MKWTKTSEKLPDVHKMLLMGGYDKDEKDYIKIGYLKYIFEDGDTFLVDSSGWEKIETDHVCIYGSGIPTPKPYVWMYLKDIGVPPLEEQV